MFEDEFPPLTPSSFFESTFEAKSIKPDKWKSEIEKETYLLPDTGWLLGEEHAHAMHLAWSEEGLYVFADIKGAFEDPLYPRISDGDSLELFIDTRGLKSSSFTNKFSHHFFFLPQAVEGITRGEITHFRTEDAHPLIDAEILKLETKVTAKGAKLKIHLPKEALHGFDSDQSQKILFSYRINHFNQPEEHFSVPSDQFPLERDPSLWTTIKLVGGPS